jgi:hypothetical protein
MHVSLEFTPPSVFDRIRVGYFFSLFLTCKPMMHVSLEFTPPSVFDMSNTDSIKHRGRGELKRNMHHWFTGQEQTKKMSITDDAHLFSLFLTCKPMMHVSLEFTPPSVFDRIRDAHLFSLFLTCKPMMHVKAG